MALAPVAPEQTALMGMAYPDRRRNISLRAVRLSEEQRACSNQMRRGREQRALRLQGEFSLQILVGRLPYLEPTLSRLCIMFNLFLVTDSEQLTRSSHFSDDLLRSNNRIATPTTCPMISTSLLRNVWIGSAESG